MAKWNLHMSQWDRKTKSDEDMKALAQRAGGVGFTPSVPYENMRTHWVGTCNRCGETISPQPRVLEETKIPCETCRNKEKRNANNRKSEAIVLEEIKSCGFESNDPYPGLKSPWLISCVKCETSRKTRLVDFRKSQKKCQVCAKTNKDQAMREEAERAGFTPKADIPYPGADRQWKGTCHVCESVTTASMASVRKGHNPCRKCAYDKREAEKLTWNAKLTEDQVKEMRSDYAQGKVTYQELGDKYELGPQYVKRIIDRKSWAGVK